MVNRISLTEVSFMSRFLAIVFVAGTCLTCAPLVLAQFDGGTRYDAHSVSTLVDRVHDDLDHAYRLKHFSNDDRERLNRAEKELREFAQTWDKGKFDVGRLDEAIGGIQHVLDNNKLPENARLPISDDVTQLHRMREAYKRHEIGL
jgi:hypothetical protein